MGIDRSTGNGVQSRGLLGAGRFLQDKRRERGKRNRSKEAPVNSEHEATVDWKQEAKVRRMKAESN